MYVFYTQKLFDKNSKKMSQSGEKIKAKQLT